MKTLSAENILFTQGFGTRHECRGLILSGRFKANDVLIEDPQKKIPVENLTFEVNGKKWPFFEKALLLMNKPPHYECSLKPIHHPSVSGLLPPALRTRCVQPVGRLDEDTTGLLLFTDDGALLHRLTHPKKHVRKTYQVSLKYPLSSEQKEKLLAGVLLKDDKGRNSDKVAADDVEILSDKEILLSISQGKYHQVKRMIAAVSNRAEHLHRVQFGALKLPEDLAPGEWRWINSPSEVTG